MNIASYLAMLFVSLGYTIADGLNLGESDKPCDKNATGTNGPGRNNCTVLSPADEQDEKGGLNLGESDQPCDKNATGTNGPGRNNCTVLSPADEQDEKGVVANIVGGTLGGVVVIVLVIVLSVTFVKRRRKREKASSQCLKETSDISNNEYVNAGMEGLHVPNEEVRPSTGSELSITANALSEERIEDLHADHKIKKNRKPYVRESAETHTGNPGPRAEARINMKETDTHKKQYSNKYNLDRKEGCRDEDSQDKTLAGNSTVANGEFKQAEPRVEMSEPQYASDVYDHLVDPRYASDMYDHLIKGKPAYASDVYDHLVKATSAGVINENGGRGHLYETTSNTKDTTQMPGIQFAQLSRRRKGEKAYSQGLNPTSHTSNDDCVDDDIEGLRVPKEEVRPSTVSDLSIPGHALSEGHIQDLLYSNHEIMKNRKPYVRASAEAHKRNPKPPPKPRIHMKETDSHDHQYSNKYTPERKEDWRHENSPVESSAENSAAVSTEFKQAELQVGISEPQFASDVYDHLAEPSYASDVYDHLMKRKPAYASDVYDHLVKGKSAGVTNENDGYGHLYATTAKTEDTIQPETNVKHDDDLPDETEENSSYNVLKIPQTGPR